MNRLLGLARFLCGEAAIRDVFEPLVADWQRELAETSGRRHAMAVVAGAIGFLTAVVRALIIGGSWVPTARAATASFLAFFFAVAAAGVVVLILAVTAGRTVDIASIQTQFYVLSMMTVMVPAALLPAMFMARSDSRSSTRHAIALLVVGCILTATAVELTRETTLREHFTSFEAFEREYRRNLANDRKGRYQYPGSAVRQLRGPTTTEQRRESYRRFVAWRQQQAQETPATWPQRIRRHQATVLGFLLGIIGWTLAGLAPPRWRRAWLWWALMLGAMLALNGPLSDALRSPVYPPLWVPLAVVLTVTLLLVAETWRTPSGRHE